jgi:hypothetical protein
MKGKTQPPPFKTLQSVQLVLDLPQTRIKPGARVLILAGSLAGKTGRVSLWYRDHIISFPGGKIKSVPRHLLVEIQ